MKIAPRQADAFVEAPDANVHAILVFGADQGLVRERADKLCRSVIDDLTDPFRVAELEGAALAKDPTHLFDEVASISLTGGRRVVRVRAGGDRLAAAMEDILGDQQGDALVVVEAGELAASSKLRKAFEKAKMGASIACYRDEGRDLTRVIEDELSAQGLRADRDVVGLMGSLLGGDRLLTRTEIAKLAVYMGDNSSVGISDVEAVMADGSFLSHERVSQAVLGRRAGDLQKALDRALAEREHPIAILGAVRRDLQRLALFLSLVAEGKSSSGALQTMRLDPRRQFRIVEPLTQAARNWTPERTAAALSSLLEADLLAKSTGYPADLICRQVLLGIAGGADARRR